MAKPIYVCSKELVVFDAKRAASCLDEAVSAMSKVDFAVSCGKFNISSLSGGSVFAASEGEIGACLSDLRTKQAQLDKLVSVMQTGTAKIEAADQEYLNFLGSQSLCAPAVNALGQMQLGAGLGVGWIAGTFLEQVRRTGANEENHYGNVAKADIAPVATGCDMKEYTDNVTDAEYARLCQLGYGAADAPNPRDAFVDMLRTSEYFPPNDPIRSIKTDQVTFIENIDGFQAFVISDGDTALVVFVGTSGDVGDYIADGSLLLGIPSSQSIYANILVHKLAKAHENIVVTGHSLGGYLATETTLYCSKVSKCVAFDPPGRTDSDWHEWLNKKQVSKITTYEAKGSLINKPGTNVGDVRPVSVKENGNAITHNHRINEISDSLDTNNTIVHSWR